MTYRLAKKRTLQKAGFVHVAGWVKADDAPKVEKMIAGAKNEVEAALDDSSCRSNEPEPQKPKAC